MAKPKKTVVKRIRKPDVAEDGLTKAILEVGEKFSDLRHIENISDFFDQRWYQLPAAIDGLADVLALTAIATHGTEADRTAAVERLKNRFAADPERVMNPDFSSN
jgi:hypothetical protein